MVFLARKNNDFQIFFATIFFQCRGRQYPNSEGVWKTLQEAAMYIVHIQPKRKKRG